MNKEMSNEVRTAEELLKEIGDVVKPFSILGMTNYMGCDPSIYNVWRKRKVLPYRNVKRIVEYLEMHSDDIVTLCQHLMEYYKSEEKKRAERVELLKQKSRQRARERNRKLLSSNKQYD